MWQCWQLSGPKLAYGNPIFEAQPNGTAKNLGTYTPEAYFNTSQHFLDKT